MGPACVIVPALDAAATVGAVVDDLRASLGLPVIVVDDGSADATGDVARARGAIVLRHEQQPRQGRCDPGGPARGRRARHRRGRDGRRGRPAPGESARAVLDGSDDPRALVLGVRDLLRDGAPAQQPLRQRRVELLPVALRAAIRFATPSAVSGAIRSSRRSSSPPGPRGFAFEGEIVLRALAAGLPLVEVPISVVYARRRARAATSVACSTRPGSSRRSCGPCSSSASGAREGASRP